MWMLCLISFMTASVSICLFSMMCMQQYRFSKNAILVQGKMVDIQTIKTTTWHKQPVQVPVIQYYFQGQGWRYCAALNLSRQDLYLGKRINLRVLHDRPAIVCSDLELIQREAWAIFFAMAAACSLIFTLYLSPYITEVWSMNIWFIVLAGSVLAGSALAARRWYKHHHLSKRLAIDQAEPLGLFIPSKISSQS